MKYRCPERGAEKFEISPSTDDHAEARLDGARHAAHQIADGEDARLVALRHLGVATVGDTGAGGIGGARSGSRAGSGSARLGGLEVERALA